MENHPFLASTFIKSHAEIEYEIFDEEGNLLTFSSEVEIGDTILTRDFVEYQIEE